MIVLASGDRYRKRQSVADRKALSQLVLSERRIRDFRSRNWVAALLNDVSFSTMPSPKTTENQASASFFPISLHILPNLSLNVFRADVDKALAIQRGGGEEVKARPIRTAKLPEDGDVVARGSATRQERGLTASAVSYHGAPVFRGLLL